MKVLAYLFLLLGLAWVVPAGAADPPLPEDRSLQVGFLAVDGVYNSELMAPYDIFHHTAFHTDPGMEVFVVSPSGEDVTTFEGLRIGAHYSFETAPPIDILVVPSAKNSMSSDLENKSMMDWVRRVGGDARFIVSLCDGAFVLAAAGLLDDVVSTTFPGDVAAYREKFPALDVRGPDLANGASFIHDGRALTSKGGALSYDVAMYLVDHLYGSRVAAGVGRGLILDWPVDEQEYSTAKAGVK